MNQITASFYNSRGIYNSFQFREEGDGPSCEHGRSSLADCVRVLVMWLTVSLDLFDVSRDVRRCQV